jgi:hypothetical protein
MSGEDSLSGRFDYLFEPLEAEESDDGIIDADSATGRRYRGGVPVALAFAAFVLGTLGVVALVALLLLQRPNVPTEPVDSSLEPTPLSTTVPVMTPPATPMAPPESPVTETATEAPQTIESAPSRQTQAQPEPTTATRESEGHVTNSPTTRAPISVAPETRQPFPSQGGQRGGPNQGDLIPGIGLPGPL